MLNQLFLHNWFVYHSCSARISLVPLRKLSDDRAMVVFWSSAVRGHSGCVYEIREMIVEFRQVSAFSEKVHRPVESLSCLHRRSTVPPLCLRCELDSRPFQNGEESSSIRVHYGLSAKSRQSFCLHTVVLHWF